MRNMNVDNEIQAFLKNNPVFFVEPTLEIRDWRNKQARPELERVISSVYAPLLKDRDASAVFHNPDRARGLVESDHPYVEQWKLQAKALIESSDSTESSANDDIFCGNEIYWTCSFDTKEALLIKTTYEVSQWGHVFRECYGPIVIDNPGTLISAAQKRLATKWARGSSEAVVFVLFPGGQRWLGVIGNADNILDLYSEATTNCREYEGSE